MPWPSFLPPPTLGTKLDSLLEDLADETFAGDISFTDHIFQRLVIEVRSFLSDIDSTIRYAERYTGFEPTIENLKQKAARFERLEKRLTEVSYK